MIKQLYQQPFPTIYLSSLSNKNILDLYMGSNTSRNFFYFW